MVVLLAARLGYLWAAWSEPTMVVPSVALMELMWAASWVVEMVDQLVALKVLQMVVRLAETMESL